MNEESENTANRSFRLHTQSEGVLLPPSEPENGQNPPAGLTGLNNLPFDHPLAATVRSAQDYARASKSAATQKAYNADWRDFTTWCALAGLVPLPASPEAVCLYIADLADRRGRKVSTITRRLTSIATAHRRAGYPSPCDMRNTGLADVYHGIRRKLGVRQAGKKAMTLDVLRAIVAAGGDTLKGTRDRALLLVGFAGGLRCSELAAIRVEHLNSHPAGVTVHLPRSKTDQEGQGRDVELPLGIQPDDTPLDELICPVRALRQWMGEAGITAGPVFRRVSWAQTVGGALNSASVRWILKQALRRAGVDENSVREYGAHSLRAGFVTVAYKNGARTKEIAQQTGHKSIVMVHKYIRDEEAAQSAARKLGM